MWGCKACVLAWASRRILCVAFTLLVKREAEEGARIDAGGHVGPHWLSTQLVLGVLVCGSLLLLLSKLLGVLV